MLQRRRHAQTMDMCEKSLNRFVQHNQAGIESRPTCKLRGQVRMSLIEQAMKTPLRSRCHLRQ